MAWDEEKNAAGPERSRFVTVLAWNFILVGGFATFVGVLQNVMIRVATPGAEMREAMAQLGGGDKIPPAMGWMMDHMALVFLVFLLVSAGTLVSAVGLLKRKEWARKVFVVLMGLGIVWSLASLVMQFTVLSPMQAVPPGQALPPEFLKAMRFAQVASAVLVVGMSVLLAFIIRKLCSERVRREFS